MPLLGPVFRYDLIRIARRQRPTLWRGLYGLTLLIALGVTYTLAFPRAGLFGGATVAPREAAGFATGFFGVFAAIQFAVVVLLTPALAAGALAEERSRHTLLFLLTTHLSNREIVLGKLLTRLLQVGMLLLTGLPVLGLLQMLGGVDALSVLAVFAGLLLTLVSLGSLGVACAVFARKPDNAAWRAYQLIILYAALAFVGVWLADPLPQVIWGWTRTAAGMTSVSVRTVFPPLNLEQELVQAFNAGNPAFVAMRVYRLVQGGTELSEALPACLAGYALFHGLLTAGCLYAAVSRLRSRSAGQSAGLVPKKARTLRPAPHPPIKDRPMLWKEIYCEAKPRQRWLALLFTRWAYLFSFLPTWILVVLALDQDINKLTNSMFLLLKYGGTLVACGLMLRAAAHAARSLGQERDRQTLDCLLVTALTPREILRDKWWGSLLAGRWLLVWLLIHWALGSMVLALHPAAVPLLLAECFIYVAFAAGLGMYCATRFPTTKQAVLATLLIGLFATAIVPWAVGAYMQASRQEAIHPGLYPYTRAPEPVSWSAIPYSLSAPRVLFHSVMPSDDFRWGTYRYYYERDDTTATIEEAILSLFLYAIIGRFLTRLAQLRFLRALDRSASGRVGSRERPENSHAH